MREVKLPLAIIIQLSTLTLTRQPTRHYQLSTTDYCLFTILISEHHRKSELPLGCFSVSAIGIILSETVKSAITKSQSVWDSEELPLTTWGPSSNTGQGGECSPVVGVVGAQGWNAGLVLLNFQTRSRPGFSEGFDDTLYIHFSVNWNTYTEIAEPFKLIMKVVYLYVNPKITFIWAKSLVNLRKSRHLIFALKINNVASL